MFALLNIKEGNYKGYLGASTGSLRPWQAQIKCSSHSGKVPRYQPQFNFYG